ncbi:unnamed protein product [Brassica rapa subsp. narinosa]
MLWYIWKSRNEFLFRQRNVHPMEDISRASDANAEWNLIYVCKKGPSVEVNRSSAWLPPPNGW